MKQDISGSIITIGKTCDISNGIFWTPYSTTSENIFNNNYYIYNDLDSSGSSFTNNSNNGTEIIYFDTISNTISVNSNFVNWSNINKLTIRKKSNLNYIYITTDPNELDYSNYYLYNNNILFSKNPVYNNNISLKNSFIRDSFGYIYKISSWNNVDTNNSTYGINITVTHFLMEL